MREQAELRFRHVSLWVLTTGALTLAVACVPEAASESPGYLSPVVQLQRLQGVNSHLHVDEVRLREDGLLFQCSYDFGIVDASNAASMRYLSERLRHTIPGETRGPGCIHLAVAEGDVVYTTHRGNIRNPAFLSGWDVSDPRAPVQLGVLQEPGVSYEGVDVANGYVYVGLHDRGLAVFRYADGGFERVGLLTDTVNAWGVRAAGDTVLVADGAGGLAIVDASDPTSPTLRGRVETGGLATDVALDGDTAYVAAGSAGLVVVDVSDRANPVVAGRAEMPGSAIRVDYSAGRAVVAAWNDARIYDVTDPGAPRFIGAARMTRKTSDDDPDRPEATSRVLGVAARGDDVIVGNWHVLYSYRLFPEREAPSIRLPETSSLVDFGAVEPGTESEISFAVANQGNAPLTVLSASVANRDYEVTPRQLQVPAGESGTLTLRFRPTDDAESKAYLQILSDDPQEPLRKAYLVANRTGLGVGMPLPEINAILLDGSDWSSTEVRGSVTLLAYFATF